MGGSGTASVVTIGYASVITTRISDVGCARSLTISRCIDINASYVLDHISSVSRTLVIMAYIIPTTQVV